MKVFLNSLGDWPVTFLKTPEKALGRYRAGLDFLIVLFESSVFEGSLVIFSFKMSPKSAYVLIPNPFCYICNLKLSN